MDFVDFLEVVWRWGMEIYDVILSCAFFWGVFEAAVRRWLYADGLVGKDCSGRGLGKLEGL